MYDNDDGSLLYVISKADDSYVSLLDDDPVRPWISREFRCHAPDNCVFVLLSQQKEPLAVLCCSFKSFVPSSAEELLKFEYSASCNAIFYSVWSYKRGSGRVIIPLASKWIRENLGHISGFYTFSPPGPVVRDFHYSLGAELHRENSDSVNYVYKNVISV